MEIQFHKIDNNSHYLKIIRNDKSFEEILLETRSYLLHDFTHYAVEKEGDFKNGFWGLLSQGYTLKELYTSEINLEELSNIEKIVGPIQSLSKGLFTIQEFLEQAKNFQEIEITQGFLENCLERIRKLNGEWKSISFKNFMQIVW